MIKCGPFNCWSWEASISARDQEVGTWVKQASSYRWHQVDNISTNPFYPLISLPCCSSRLPVRFGGVLGSLAGHMLLPDRSSREVFGRFLRVERAQNRSNRSLDRSVSLVCSCSCCVVGCLQPPWTCYPC